MTRRSRRAFILVVLGLLGVGAPVPARAADPGLGLGNGGSNTWITDALPAVVSISTFKFVADPERGGALRRIIGYGSGFVADKSGLIITNRHVIDGVSDVVVILRDQSRLRAKPLYIGLVIDLALLRVNAGRDLPALQFGDSDKLQVGDVVAAVGNPLELGGSVSAGIVSALNRDIKSSPYDDFIQTDAAINHGNSGGPLIDMHGRVIGVNTAIYSPSDTSGSIGIGFAAPSNDVQFVVSEILRYGKIRAGWLGADAQTVTPPIALAIGAPQSDGSIIAHVTKGSPADTGGLQVGDLIMRVGKRQPMDSRALARAVAEIPPGEDAAITYWRAGKTADVTVKLGEWQDHPMKGMQMGPQPRIVREDMKDLGLRLGPLGADQRRKLGIASGASGVAVVSVALNSPAADIGVLAGDVMRRVQLDEVGTPQVAQERLAAAKEQHLPYVLLLIQRADGFHWLPVPTHNDQF